MERSHKPAGHFPLGDLAKLPIFSRIFHVYRFPRRESGKTAPASPRPLEKTTPRLRSLILLQRVEPSPAGRLRSPNLPPPTSPCPHAAGGTPYRTGDDTMPWIDMLLPVRRHARLKALADQIARASVEAVCRRVEHRLAELGPAEARGYIRARSAAIVEPMTDSLLTRHPARLNAHRERLIAMSRDEVIGQVLQRIRGRQRQVAPVRRAA